MISLINKNKKYGDILSIKNNNIEVFVTNFGCTIMKMIVKDKYDNLQDVVLGYSSVEEYAKRDGAYLGALVGRVANRIGKGEFELDGVTYHLAINNGPNTLHGGVEGFSYKLFDYDYEEDGNEIVFTYVSEDYEEGFPGQLTLKAIYTLLDNGLKITYQAISTKDTLINITNHSYFNLSGKPSNIDCHILKINADLFACVDKDGLYNGEIRKVNNTPFDFREPTRISENIYKEYDQLIIGKGYDHPFIFNKENNQVELYNEDTGICLTVSTTLPQAQIYSANYLAGQTGKCGFTLNERDAICIETQNMPDSIHKESNPTVILKEGETYEESTSYMFSVK